MYIFTYTHIYIYICVTSYYLLVNVRSTILVLNTCIVFGRCHLSKRSKSVAQLREADFFKKHILAVKYMTQYILPNDCLLIALDAHMFGHNGHGPGTGADGPRGCGSTRPRPSK